MTSYSLNNIYATNVIRTETEKVIPSCKVMYVNSGSFIAYYSYDSLNNRGYPANSYLFIEKYSNDGVFQYRKNVMHEILSENGNLDNQLGNNYLYDDIDPFIGYDPALEELYISFHTYTVENYTTPVSLNLICLTNINSSTNIRIKWCSLFSNINNNLLNTTQTDRQAITSSIAIRNTSLYVVYSFNLIINNEEGYDNDLFDTVVASIKKSDGSVNWIKELNNFNSSGNDRFPYIAVDNSTGIYITYETTSNIPTKTRTGTTDVVGYKLTDNDTDSALIWTLQSNLMNGTGVANGKIHCAVLYDKLFTVHLTNGVVPNAAVTNPNNLSQLVISQINTSTGVVDKVSQPSLININANVNLTQPRIGVLGGNIVILHSINYRPNGINIPGDADSTILRLDIFTFDNIITPIITEYSKVNLASIPANATITDCDISSLINGFYFSGLYSIIEDEYKLFMGSLQFSITNNQTQQDVSNSVVALSNSTAPITFAQLTYNSPAVLHQPTIHSGSIVLPFSLTQGRSIYQYIRSSTLQFRP